MRITSGKYKGKIIKTPGTAGVHPMGERERLALFNMAGNNLSGLTVLDAFSGSGALGIEALSRGARKVMFVEKSPKTARIIKENLKKLDKDSIGNYELLVQDVKKITLAEKFNLIIADPPYDNFELNTVLNLTNFLEDDGILALSHPDIAPTIIGLSIVKTKKYARAHITIYEKTII